MKTQAEQGSPRPWRVPPQDHDKNRVYGHHGDLVAVFSAEVSHSRACENCAKAVHAVNHFDEVVGALSELTTLITSIEEDILTAEVNEAGETDEPRIVHRQTCGVRLDKARYMRAEASAAQKKISASVERARSILAKAKLKP